MKITLIIFFLSVQSSYSNNTEIPATPESFDTIQFVQENGKCWRIKTFAQDQDVHVWSIGSDSPDIFALAKSNTAKHYGDLLVEGYLIETEDGLDGVRSELKNRGLDAHLELLSAGGLFWTPLNSQYRTKSVPN